MSRPSLPDMWRARTRNERRRTTRLPLAQELGAGCDVLRACSRGAGRHRGPGGEVGHLVPSPRHNYHDQKSGLAEIHLRFEIPIRILMTRSRYLHDLAVHPRYHGMGIGRALLQRVIVEAAEAAPPLRSITLTAVRAPRSRLDRLRPSSMTPPEKFFLCCMTARLHALSAGGREKFSAGGVIQLGLSLLTAPLVWQAAPNAPLGARRKK